MSKYGSNISTFLSVTDLEIKLPLFKKTFIPHLEHINDPLDVSLKHFHHITTPFKIPNHEDRKNQQLHGGHNIALNISGLNISGNEELTDIYGDMEQVFGKGINIKYFDK